MNSIANSLFQSAAWQAYTNQLREDPEIISHNEKTLSYIGTLLPEGQGDETLRPEPRKLCLFIGREAQEELPEETNTIWISLDISKRNIPSFDPKRLHLILDCNDATQLNLIQSIFHKVVVDQSTWKFFNVGIIERLISLLFPKSTSTLIFESKFQFFSLTTEEKWQFDHINLEIPENEMIRWTQQGNKFHDNFIAKIGGDSKLEGTCEYQEFLNQLPPDLLKDCSQEELHSDFKTHFMYKNVPSLLENYTPMARQKTLDYLKTLFQQADCKINATYPYPTRYSTPGMDCFFQATGPNKPYSH